jgi:hypothetical protein
MTNGYIYLSDSWKQNTIEHDKERPQEYQSPKDQGANRRRRHFLPSTYKTRSPSKQMVAFRSSARLPHPLIMLNWLLNSFFRTYRG